MKCSLCDNNNAHAEDTLGDCVLDFLDRIKAHYISFKIKLDKSESTIEELQARNGDLLQTIDNLKDDLQRASPDNRKRHKTNSFETEDDGRDALLNIRAVLPDKSTDDLNEVLDDCDKYWDDDSFFAPPTQEQQIMKKSLNTVVEANDLPNQRKFEEKQNIPPPIVLSPINQNIPLKRSPRDRVLPKRKATPTRPKAGSDQGTTNVSKWISKEQLVNSPGHLKKYMSSPLLPQPVQPIEIIDDSPNEQQENRGLRRNLLSTRNSNKKLHQTKLNFSKNVPIKTSTSLTETFCEDLVAASPTSANIASNEIGKLSKMKFTRKTTRVQADMSLSLSPIKKDGCSSAKDFEELIGSSPSKRRIKTEPITVKKDAKTNLEVQQSPTKKRYFDEPLDGDDSSIFVLPSQPDDLIHIEETGETSSSVDLLNDMILQEDRLADLLRELETTSPKEEKKGDKPKSEKPPENFKTPVRVLNLPTFGCSECETYFKFIAKDLTPAEMAKRLRNCCKHKKPISLHHTPEGFWDPHFRPLSPDDPRNLTLIDTRFIDKK